MKVEVRWRPVKYARVEVKPDGRIVVTAPRGFDVDGLIKKHSAWIEGKLTEIEGLKEMANSGFPFKGEFYRVIRGTRAKVHERFKTVTLPPMPDEMMALLKRFLRPEVEGLIEKYAEKMGVKPGKVFIRDQKTRWGSCSPRGNLNFNVRLIAVPEELLNYVVIHELAHLRHMDHSKEFWQLVGRFYPDYRKAREELRKWWTIIELNEYWKWMEGRP